MRAKLVRASLLAALAAATVAPPILADDATPATISNIRQENGAHATRLVVEATVPLAYTYYSPDPLTLVVDIPEVDASKLPAHVNVGTPEVESLQVTTLARADGRQLSRLEVKLAGVVPYQIYSKERSLNLVFERPAAAAAAEAAPPPAAETAPPAAPTEAQTADAVEPAPEAAAPPPAPAVPDRGPATRILSVSATSDSGRPEVIVKADGRLTYQDFFLGNPDRLVLDLKDVVTAAANRTVDVNAEPVKRVRLAQFSVASPRVARLVVDLQARSAYHIVEAADGLRLVFGEGKPATVPLASIKKPVAPPVAAEPAEAPLVFSPGSRPNSPALIVSPATPLQAAPPSGAEPFSGGDDRKFDSAKRFTGHPINLDFKDGDLQDIFRLFADISGLNVVVNPGVSGKITLKLTEVPWDQALDLILKTNGLGYTLDDNVIRIAKLSDLQREEAEKQKLAEAKELAGELVAWRKALSYAKAEEMGSLVNKVALSPRGVLNVDKRTNTLIISDLPDRIEKAKDLIAELDRATPQVEIEARIVATTRNFTRDIGIQWGFLNRQTPDFGTTTNRQFPNSIVLNGQGVPSQGGISADQNGVASDEGIGLTGRGYAVNLPAAGFNSALGVSMGNIIGSFNLDAAITALERQGRGRILSSPKVTTQNNQEAEIKQGVQIPIQTVANNTVTVTFKDAVLTLKVTPQITSAGTVLLKVEVENNTPDFGNTVNGIPPINTQAAKTNVLVSDGATTVIGGIYQNQESLTVNSTPLLGKIPLLGYLFRQKASSSASNELLLFITPRITKG